MTSWTCPYCNHVQTLTSPKTDAGWSHISIGENAHGPCALVWQATCCSNPVCREFTLKAQLRPWNEATGAIVYGGKDIERWQLRPSSSAKPWPAYIPQQIRDDYREACLIQSLSPKASATLSRRCLQGMIRDFGKVTPGTLYKEIEELAEAVRNGTAPREVSVDSIAALTSLRKIGNIGAHMEADVDLIVPVDPDEAGAMIDIIELLIDDWYVERHKRSARFARVSEIETEKAAIIAAGKAKPKLLAAPEGMDKPEGGSD